MAGPGASEGSGARLEDGLEGWDKGCAKTQPSRRLCLFLASTRHRGELTDGKRRRNACNLDLVPPVRAPQGCQPPLPLPSPVAESASSLLPLGRESGGGRRCGGGGEDARRAGRFSLCPSKAAPLTALRAVLLARLGWVAASTAAPQRLTAGDSS